MESASACTFCGRAIFIPMQTQYCVQPQDGKKLEWSLLVPPIQDRGLVLQVNNVKFLRKLKCFLSVYIALRNVPGPALKGYKKFLSQCKNPWPDQCRRSMQV